MENLERKIVDTGSLEELERVRIEIFGKKGALAAEFARLKDIPGPEKKAFAQGLNDTKARLQKLYDERYESLKSEETARRMREEALDLSLYSNISERVLCIR